MRHNWVDPEPANLTKHRIKIYLATVEQNRNWLADQLGISRTTLNRRIEEGDWRKGELEIWHRLLSDEQDGEAVE